jgi:hypothetical protein
VKTPVKAKAPVKAAAKEGGAQAAGPQGRTGRTRQARPRAARRGGMIGAPATARGKLGQLD